MDKCKYKDVYEFFQLSNIGVNSPMSVLSWHSCSCCSGVYLTDMTAIRHLVWFAQLDIDSPIYIKQNDVKLKKLDLKLCFIK